MNKTPKKKFNLKKMLFNVNLTFYWFGQILEKLKSIDRNKNDNFLRFYLNKTTKQKLDFKCLLFNVILTFC